MFILGIIMHELGHLIGGLMSGYHFLHIEVLGLSLEKIGGRIQVKHYKNAPIGQCLMYSETIEKNGAPLAAGGIVMNLLIGLLNFSFFMVLDPFVIRVLLLAAAMANVSLAIMNLFGSDTSDGNTLKEILSSNDNMRIYNRLLQISKYLREGKSYSDMPEEYFDIVDEGSFDMKKYTKKAVKMKNEAAAVNPISDRAAGSGTSLKSEMKIHFCRYLMECGILEWDKNAAGAPIDVLVEEKLHRLISCPKRQDNSIDVLFMEIVNKGRKNMYSGEYLSAARCFKQAGRHRMEWTH